MNIIIVCAVIGYSCVIVIPLLMNISVIKNIFKQMNHNKLVKVNTNAKKMMKLFLGIAILLPAPFCLFIDRVSNPILIDYLIFSSLLTVMIGVIGFSIFFGIFRITNKKL